jgi:crossover junction endodeoxyribonuclease RuvC
MNEKFDQVAIGIDPGLNSTGWGIVGSQGSKLIYLASGTIKISLKLSLAEKLLTIYKEICNQIEQHQPKVFAIEETYVNDNPSTSLKLGQARGVAILAAAYNNLDVFEYAPRFVKKAIVGKGNADKVQVAAMINHLLHHKIADHNESDAIAIAICHINCHKFYSK